MKLIGIDYGRRRIGCAVCDETGSMVRGLATITVRTTADAFEKLLALLNDQQPAGVVFGLPLDANDRDTRMAVEIRKFAADLETNSAIPVYFIDESNTSKQAADLMLFRRKKERRNKAAIDRLAACLILESFLREMKCAH
ncbi:MAG: Holliday junction resolvase RuvX [Chitinispirillaceae bacterium]|nr:Holliday junction resolvase RuvX [Chitinispirillaceae bacterium]